MWFLRGIVIVQCVQCILYMMVFFTFGPVRKEKKQWNPGLFFCPHNWTSRRNYGDIFRREDSQSWSCKLFGHMRMSRTFSSAAGNVLETLCRKSLHCSASWAPHQTPPCSLPPRPHPLSRPHGYPQAPTPAPLNPTPLICSLFTPSLHEFFMPCFVLVFFIASYIALVCAVSFNRVRERTLKQMTEVVVCATWYYSLFRAIM